MATQENKKALPYWLRIFAVFIPIIIALFVWRTRMPSAPPPCDGDYPVIGTAYYESGKEAIQNASIRVFDVTMNPTFTASDGSFKFPWVEVSCKITHIKIGIKIQGSDGYVTTTVPVRLNNRKKEIDLGAVVFPIVKKEAIPKPLPRKKRKLSKTEDVHENPIPLKEELMEVRIMYPEDVTLQSPEIEIYPNAEFESGFYSCVVTAAPGNSIIKLTTEKGYWEAPFNGKEGVVPATKFKFFKK